MISDGPQSQTAAEALLFAERFRADILLKQTLGIHSWRGTDLVTGRAVIIKTIGAAGTSIRLADEAAALQRLKHPALATLLAIGHHGGEPFLVMPEVPGRTLAHRLLDQPLTVGETLAVATCLLAALQEAHANGVLHRDIKPDNVMVDDGPEVRHAVLIDFGLASIERPAPTLHDVPAGTVRHMSPEQAGVLDLPVDGRSDLYAVGTVLFECLAGRPALQGASVRDVLRGQLAEAPPDLRTLGLAVPRALAELIRKLLQLDPEDRYQSAEAVLGDCLAIAAAVAQGVADPPCVIGGHDQRRTLTEPAFIGRAAELAALEALVGGAAAGHGGLAVVEALSGGGKTRLFEELARRCAPHGAWVLQGGGVDHMAVQPFQVLKGVTEAVLNAAGTDAALARRLRHDVGDAQQAICDALPELAALLETRPAASSLPADYGVQRTQQALATLLDSLGRPDSPAVILLDDCQWADEQTMRLLHHWQQRQAARGQGWTLVVAAFRSENPRSQAWLELLAPMATIVLDPFSDDEVAGMSQSMAGDLPEQAVAIIARLANGNPFMSSAVLRGLVESGALHKVDEAWVLDQRRLTEVRSSHESAILLTRRVEQLSPGTRQLLSVGAVLGKAFDPDLANTLAGTDMAATVSALAEARQRHLLWAHDASDRCVFVHDKLREALLALLPADARRHLHRRAALQLETTSPEATFDIAYHFDMAGEPLLAMPYALAAADRALARHALEIAEHQLRIAERGATTADIATRRRLAASLGDVLMRRGLYDEAREQLETVSGLAQDDTTRAAAACQLGELDFKQGQVAAAITILERALRLYGRSIPRSTAGFAVRLLWEGAVQVVHTLAPRLFVGRRPPDTAKARLDLLAARVYSRLAYAYWFQSGKIPCAWAHLRELNLAERYPASPERAQAYSEHAPVMTMLPAFARAHAYAAKSLAMRRALGDVWGEGQSLHFDGVALYGASRFQDCLAQCRQAVQLLDRTGDRWEANTAGWHIAFAEYRLGNLAEAATAARRLHQVGIEIGDHQAIGYSLGVWSKATGGLVPASLIQTELAHDRHDAATRAELLQAEGIRLLRLGQCEEAVARLQEAADLVRRSGLRQEYVAPILPWLATALRQQIEQLPPFAATERRLLLRRGLAAAGQGRRLARSYRNNLPHALRELAWMRLLAGTVRGVRQALDESLAVAESQGARDEAAQTRLARGRIGRVMAWPDAAHDVVVAEAALGALHKGLAEAARPPEPVTLSLVDQFGTLLEVGRKIVLSLSAGAVYQAVHEAASTLLRPESCWILMIGPDGELCSHVGPAPRTSDYSQTLLRQVIETNRLVVLTPEETGSGSDSLILSGLRSALCVPLTVRGTLVGCLYVTHRLVGGLFGDDAQRLAGFIATLAGAALENAEGFAAAEAAIRMRDDFISIASHELRTPLTSLTLQIGSMKRLVDMDAPARPEGAVDDLLGNIERQIHRLDQLITDLLGTARFSDDHLALRREHLDLTAVVRRVVTHLAIDLEQAACQVVLHADEPVLGRWDRSQLERVLSNLLSNAMKFGKGKPITVTVSQRGGWAVMTVQDEGIGIAPGDQERIFARFVRAVSARHFGGFGLGLWIARQLVEAHGGWIEATSALGQGSTFLVTLPLAADEA